MSYQRIIIGILSCVLYSCTPNKLELKEEELASTDSISKINKEVTTMNYSKLLGDLYIEIPDGLEEMPEDKVKLKYPGANRPDFVYGTEDMGVNLCYSITKTPMKLSELSEYLKKTTQAINIQIGKENVSQSIMDTINQIPFAILEFYSPTPDEGRIYNLMFTTSLNDKMVVISFNCLESNMNKWENIVSEVFSTIQLKK